MLQIRLKARLFLYASLALFFFSMPLKAAPNSPFGSKKRPTVCLNMIVKNESHVIRRCLESVLPIIDYWVICDTGSTDGTQEIIKDYMEEKRIPGELHECPWVNFGHNREEALTLAKFKADYVLFMDADDILRFSDDFQMPWLTHDSYMVQSMAGATRYMLTRLIKSSVDWHWYGVLHEYVFTKNAGQSAVLPGVEYIYLCDGARALDPDKCLKDSTILLEALEKEPDNARYMFYLAQTYVCGMELEKGIEYYQKRIEMGGWDQEVYWSMLQVAQLQGALGYDEATVRNSFIKAIKYRPTRIEPYVFLVSEARKNGEYQKGYELAKVGVSMPITKDILFVELKAYDALLLEFALCAWWTSHYDESLEASEKLLSKQDLDPEIRPYAIETKKEALIKLNQETLNGMIDDIFAES